MMARLGCWRNVSMRGLRAAEGCFPRKVCQEETLASRKPTLFADDWPVSRFVSGVILSFMKILALIVGLLLSSRVLAAAPSVADLNGEWVIAEAQNAGEYLTDDQLGPIEQTWKDGTYSFRFGDVKARGTLKLNPAASPATMDIHEDEGLNAGRDILAIYEKSARGVRVCYALGGGARPTEFKSTSANGWFLADLKRKPGTEPASGASRPLNVLLITGGCCHEYARQAITLSEGISKRVNARFTVVQDAGADGTKHRISVYEKENWSNGYDLVLHNECYADEKDPEWLERIVKPHRAGLPAVVIHCAMHCYRAPTPEWFKFVGVTSHRHGSHFDYVMTNVKAEHPIMAGMPTSWRTPKEELYHIEKCEPTAIPLATGWSHETKRGEVNSWVNTYGSGKVFGTTIGHYDETMRQEWYLDMVSRGVLWAAGKLGDDGKPIAGYGPVK